MHQLISAHSSPHLTRTHPRPGALDTGETSLEPRGPKAIVATARPCLSPSRASSAGAASRRRRSRRAARPAPAPGLFAGLPTPSRARARARSCRRPTPARPSRAWALLRSSTWPLSPRGLMVRGGCPTGIGQDVGVRRPALTLWIAHVGVFLALAGTGVAVAAGMAGAAIASLLAAKPAPPAPSLKDVLKPNASDLAKNIACVVPRLLRADPGPPNVRRRLTKSRRIHLMQVPRRVQHRVGHAWP